MGGEGVTEWGKGREGHPSLFPTLTHLEAQLVGHQQGQHKQCPLHSVSRQNVLLRATFLQLYKLLAP